MYLFKYYFIHLIEFPLQTSSSYEGILIKRLFCQKNIKAEFYSISNLLCLHYTWNSKKHNHVLRDMFDQFIPFLVLANVIYRFLKSCLSHLETYTLIKDKHIKEYP